MCLSGKLLGGVAGAATHYQARTSTVTSATAWLSSCSRTVVASISTPGAECVCTDAASVRLSLCARLCFDASVWSRPDQRPSPDPPGPHHRRRAVVHDTRRVPGPLPRKQQRRDGPCDQADGVHRTHQHTRHRPNSRGAGRLLSVSPLRIPISNAPVETRTLLRGFTRV